MNYSPFATERGDRQINANQALSPNNTMRQQALASAIPAGPSPIAPQRTTVHANDFSASGGAPGSNNDYWHAIFQNYLDRLQGRNPLIDQQLQAAQQSGMQQQQALMASAAPQNAAMAARIGAQNMGRLNYGLAGQSQMAHLQDQMQAGNALANALGTQGGLSNQLYGINTQARTAQEQMANERALAQMQIEAQRQLAQAQQPSTFDRILGGLSSVGGAIAGGLIGGPMGASVGSQLGGGLASAFGPSKNQTVGRSALMGAV